jgi:hypothetical protein
MLVESLSGVDEEELQELVSIKEHPVNDNKTVRSKYLFFIRHHQVHYI